ncbi:von Willebrand factor type A domain-containing protein [Myxococcaceae bacterium JPH2]|nr:von Willebrand factor type A domain-containing protein [Myxococcaceae bacterium JPH2]
MSSTFQKRRATRWGCAILAASLLSSCSSQLAPVESKTAPRVSNGSLSSTGPATPKPEGASAEADDAPQATGAIAQPSTPPPPPAPKDVAPAAEAVMVMRSSGAPAPSAARREAPSKKVPASEKFMQDKDGDARASAGGNTFEAYKPNAFTETAKDALSTFAADVDTASYTVARRYLQQGQLPPTSAVRVEEFVNYFKFRYAPPTTGAFSVHLEGAPSPFNPRRHFLRVGVQGKVVSRSQRKPAHLVFLVDTSGSMQSEDKLPLAREAMKIAVKNLNENDTVAIVTYAGSTRDVLPPTPATDVQRIYSAIDTLSAGGGTAMGSGMQMAYGHAVKKAAGGVVSRVVVLTDGDANIGPNLGADAMLESVHKYVAEGVTLTTVGFGMGNYRDDMMEKLADKGNGNSFYVDSLKEARKVFETQLTGTLEVIAKDVKFQVEFNPKSVSRYRLLGYENRDIADKDFRDDKVDAGEIGAGHNVTALYEVELTGAAQELATVRIRAKAPNGTEAAEQSFPLTRAQVHTSLDEASPDFRFALAVAATADILRAAPAAEGWSLGTTQKLAEGSANGDADRTEFVRLVTQARALSGASARGN